MRYIIFILSLFMIGCSSKGVIGVMYNQDGIVRNVFLGSPASKAGIQENDKILYHRSTKGKPGTKVKVKWIDVSDNNKLRCEELTRVHVDTLGTDQW